MSITNEAADAGNSGPDAPRDKVLIATITRDRIDTYPIKVSLHPTIDGNGRMGRFLMNAPFADFHAELVKRS